MSESGIVLGTVAPYMAIYLLDRRDLVGILPAAYIAPMIASIPLWVIIARRFGRARSWGVSMAIAGVGYATLFWVDRELLVPTMPHRSERSRS